MKNLFIAAVVGMAALFARDARGAVYSNPSTITFSTTTPGGIPGVSSPYPSTINVSGLSGTITALTVTLSGINHDRPDDIQVLLVGPTGAKYVLMADVGGTSVGAVGVNLTFSDAAGSQLPDGSPLLGGTFRPTCVDFQNTINTDFSAPAPVGPYSVAAPRGAATLASVFNGTAPNGNWTLYTVDDIANPTPVNTIANGWSLDITTGAIQATVTTLASTPNPSFTTPPNNSVTFTATVRSNGVAVGSQGTVTFQEGATVLAGPTALNASGQASFVTSALSEGNHNITAFYSGTASLNVSDGSTTQMVNNHTTVSSNQFWNLGLISIPDTGSPSTPAIYPSQIFVAGLTGTVSKVSVTLSNLTHANPDDFKLLLVGPSGAQFVLLGNVGGSSAIGGVTFTLDDAAGSLLPDTGPLSTGTFRPSFVASSTAVFPTPAPVGPYNQPAPAGAATLASVFNGSIPNGTWSLYVVDDIAGNGSGSIGAWGLAFTTSGDAATTTTIASSVNPSIVGQSVTFTATVKRSSDNSAVTVGTVTFREGATVLGGPVGLNGSGTAAFSTAALSEGTHVVSADYNGSPGSFNVSSGSITQTVDGITVVNGTMFCNTGAVQIVSGPTASAYPSRINVSGLNPSFCRISVTISNLSIDSPDDVELLLVSPTGAKFVLLSDAGGTAVAANNVTLVLSDDAASLVPDAGPMTSGTYRPTDVSSTPASFPPPAPIAPYLHPAPTGAVTLNGTFVGSSPNGYWSLYVVDDVLGGQALTIANGWCLNFIYPPVATVGGPQSVIFGGVTAGLGGNPPFAGTGAWSVDGGGSGTFSPNVATPNATFTHTGGNGPISLRWTLTDPVCGSSFANLVVTVIPSTNIVVNATDTGWYDSTGSHSPGNANYVVGNDSGTTFRNWFVFNIPPLPAPLIRAELRINTYGVICPTGSEIYQLRQVTTPVATLAAGGSGLTGIYNDLGDGPTYASRAFVPLEANRFVTIPLNQTLRSAVSGAAGGLFATGGEIATLDADINNQEYVFGFSLGNPGDVQLLLTVGAGDIPIVGYFTDGNAAATGPNAPILSAGFTPLHIGDITTQSLAGLRILLINEFNNGAPTPALLSRLPDIQAWVNAGGRLMVHDRGAGLTTPNPFLLGTPGLGTVSALTSDLNMIDPATTLVSAGPFGILTNTSLDGGSSSAHGYVPVASLPPQSRAILSFAGNSNQIAGLSYPLGAGFVYYSTIPLDYYLAGAANVITTNLQTIYTPNALIYLHTLNAPLRFLPPGLAGGSVLPLYLGNADNTPMSPDRVPQIRVHSATNLAAPVTWTLLNNPLVFSNGLVRVDGVQATNFPSTFFRALETP
jgi:subtilisin-like proprotein convertase family protein